MANKRADYFADYKSNVFIQVRTQLKGEKYSVIHYFSCLVYMYVFCVEETAQKLKISFIGN